MSGLLPPLTGAITQAFNGHASQEPIGWLVSNSGGPLRARKGLAPLAGGRFYSHLHGAIDVACPLGTPVHAVADGVIVAAGTYSQTGEHYVMLRFSREDTMQALFFGTHLKAGTLVHAVGSHVRRGAVIALSGNSGMSTGPHLHYEIRRGPALADPRLSGSWMKWNPRRLQVGGDLADLPWL